RKVNPDDHLLVPGRVGRDDLPRTPVREPQSTVVPARRLAERNTLQEHLRARHQELLPIAYRPTRPPLGERLIARKQRPKPFRIDVLASRHRCWRPTLAGTSTWCARPAVDLKTCLARSPVSASLS